MGSVGAVPQLEEAVVEEPLEAVDDAAADEVVDDAEADDELELVFPQAATARLRPRNSSDALG